MRIFGTTCEQAREPQGAGPVRELHRPACGAASGGRPRTRRGEAKIRQLIETLDLRKDEAIERTFKVCLSMTRRLACPASAKYLPSCTSCVEYAACFLQISQMSACRHGFEHAAAALAMHRCDILRDARPVMPIGASA